MFLAKEGDTCTGHTAGGINMTTTGGHLATGLVRAAHLGASCICHPLEQQAWITPVILSALIPKCI